MKPIAVQMYSLRDQAKEDLPGVLKALSGMGYTGVEFAGLYGHAPDDVRRMLDDAGLEAAGAHMRPTAENFDEVVETCRTLGLRRIGSGVGPDQFTSAEDVAKVAEEFQATAEKLKAAGLGFYYHNHWWEMQTFDGKLGLEMLYERAPDLEAQVDTYWASDFGRVDVAALVSRHAGRIPLLHLKDGPLVQDQAHVAVGSGKMDFAPIVAAADETALEWLIVELDRCDTDMMEAVERSARYLFDSGLGASKA